MGNQIERLVTDDHGISGVEYALLLALLGAGIAAAAFGFGDQVSENILSASVEIAGGS